MSGDDRHGEARQAGQGDGRTGSAPYSLDLAQRTRPTVRPADFRRFLRQVGLGALVPGLGLIAARRRLLGGFVLAVFLLGAAAAVVYGVSAGRAGLVRLWSDADVMLLVAAGLAATAVVWLVVAVAGLYILQPAGLRVAQRLLAAFVVIVAGSVAVAPLSIGSRYALTQHDFIASVFADDQQHSLTIPGEASAGDPWAGQPRVNVLILGADSGPNRDGTRTDTVMVASIDTETGDTALFSLPRNLQHAPMPDGPLREAYPNGYRGQPEAEYWLSSIYSNVPVEFPEYFKDIADPGAEALKLIVGEALGLDISYYVMVNLRGFQYLVDALGGVELDVPYRIPIATRLLSNGTCSQEKGWIEKGDDQHLDGYHALWFARARCGPGPVSDDYERMRRQRCVIGAIAEQADPFRLLTRYQQLAAAAKDTMSTDIRQERLADFAELALKVQEAGIRSLPFTDEIVNYYDPDYDLIRAFVRKSLQPPEDQQDEPSEGPSPSKSASPLGDKTPDASDSPGPANTPQPSSTGEETPPSEWDGAQSIDDVC